MNQLICTSLLALLLPSSLQSIKFQLYDEDKKDYLSNEREVFSTLAKKYKGPGTDFQIRAEGDIYTIHVIKQSFDISKSGGGSLSGPVVSAEKRNIGKDCLGIMRKLEEKTQVSAELIKNTTPPQITLSAYSTPETAHLFLSLRLTKL